MLTNRPSPFSVTSVPEPVEGPQTTSFERLVELMVRHDMEKVAADHVAGVMRTNLAEYLEKGLVK